MKKNIVFLVLIAFVSSILVGSSVTDLGGGLPSQTGNSGKYLTTDGSSASWALISGSGITTLNGLTADPQTFAVGTSGTDFAISSSTATHTFNLPNASASARGVVSTAAQVFGGAKRFQDSLYVGSAPSAAWPLSVDATPVLSSGVYQTGNIIGRRTVSTSDDSSTTSLLAQTLLTVSAGQSSQAQASGCYGQVKADGAGTTALATGVRADVQNIGTGGISDAVSLFAGTMGNSGGGSIVNTYGLFLRNNTVGANNYPIYSEGTKESYLVAGASLATGKFFVSNNGDLNKIDNVYYNWPSSQGSSSTVLTNDGNGNLSWASGGGGGITGSGTDTYLTKFTGAGSVGNSHTTEDSIGITTKTNDNASPTDTYYQENVTYNTTYQGARKTTAAMSAASSDNYFAMDSTAISLTGTNSVSNLQSTGSYLNMSGGTYSGGAVQLKGYSVAMSHNNQVTDNIAGYNWSYGSHGVSSTVSGGSSGSAISGFFRSYSTKNSVAVEGYASNGVSSGRSFGGRFIATGDNSAQAVGLYAGIYATQSDTAESYDPGFSAAFVANNGNTTSNIATLLDNGGSVFQVQDGGSTVIGAHAGTATHVINGTAKIVRQAPVSVVALTDGASVALDASLGNTFRLAAGGDRTLSAPTNPIDGQKITVIHYASGGSRTLTLTTGAGGFRFGTDITALSATSSGKSDYLGFIYNAADNRWDIVAAVKGY